MKMEGVYQKCTPSKDVYIFMYLLHFSLVHSMTVIDVLLVIYVISKFFALRCESVTYYMQCRETLKPGIWNNGIAE